MVVKDGDAIKYAKKKHMTPNLLFETGYTRYALEVGDDEFVGVEDESQLDCGAGVGDPAEGENKPRKSRHLSHQGNPTCFLQTLAPLLTDAGSL